MSKQNNQKNQQSKSNQRNTRGGCRRGQQKVVDGAVFKDQDTLVSKGERRAAIITNTEGKLSESNPVSFYTKFSQFALDSANIPFTMPLGSRFEMSAYNNDATPALMEVEIAHPGVMVIEFTPTIGTSLNFSSPINRSSIRFYTYLRSNQKASAAYDHQDVTMMEVSLDSCYMFHALLTKIYGVVNNFTPVNEYYARALVEGLDVDFDNIRKSLQDFRAYINSFAYSLGQYAMPEHVTLFDRHRWMCEGLYTDSPSVRAQTYMFKPSGFWSYNEATGKGSECVFKRYANPTKPYTSLDLQQFGDQLLQAISNVEDFAIISGDIYNFYGGATYKLPYVDENYRVLPVYDPIVLSQIENATVVGSLDASTLKITQDPSVNGGAIYFYPRTSNLYKSCPRTIALNMHKDNPSPEDIIEATRLTAVMIPGSTVGSTSYGAAVTACGTELVNGLKIYTRGVDGYEVIYTTSGLTVLTTQNLVSWTSGLLARQQFAQCPQLEVYTKDGDNYKYVGTTWDVDNFNVISRQYLTNIHTACLLSLFTVGTNQD